MLLKNYYFLAILDYRWIGFLNLYINFMLCVFLLKILLISKNFCIKIKFFNK